MPAHTDAGIQQEPELSRLGIQILIFAASLAASGGFVAIFVSYARRAKDPVSPLAASNNEALRTLASRLGLTYVEPPPPNPAWTPFGYVSGTVEGYPILVCARCRSFSYEGRLYVHTVLEAALGTIRPGLGPMALARALPEEWRGDQESLFVRSFGPLPRDGPPVRVPPPPARDALLDLAREAVVVMVEADSLRVVPGRRNMGLVQDPDDLQRWVQRLAQAARQVATSTGAEGEGLKEVLRHQYGFESLDQSRFVKCRRR